MADLKSKHLIVLKGILFLLIGIIAGGLILAYVADWYIAILLILTIWGFCRFYYFAFYVIEHYVDPAYKFAGLLDFVKYWLKKKK